MAINDFLDLPLDVTELAHAQVLLLPIPFEATVSYGHGTANGPAAIITASQQVELYDREFDREPALNYGVHTLPALELPTEPAAAVAAIAAAVTDAAKSGKLVVGLGGEHTVSVGFGRGLVAGVGGPLTVVQIDAHCDLRDSYEGTPYSHACIARRLLEDAAIEQVLQLGIRSLWAERANPQRKLPLRAANRSGCASGIAKMSMPVIGVRSLLSVSKVGASILPSMWMDSIPPLSPPPAHRSPMG